MRGRGRSYNAGQRPELREGGRRAFELDTREPMQPDVLDQRVDLRLCAAEPDALALRAQPTGEYREVDHQRQVGERQLVEVDDDVGARMDRPGERLAPTTLRASVLIAAASQERGLVIEVDDSGNLPEVAYSEQGLQPHSRTLGEWFRSTK